MVVRRSREGKGRLVAARGDEGRHVSGREGVRQSREKVIVLVPSRRGEHLHSHPRALDDSSIQRQRYGPAFLLCVEIHSRPLSSFGAILEMHSVYPPGRNEISEESIELGASELGGKVLD